MLIKIKNEELAKELIGDKKDFPKYTTQLINLANQNSQGTRPRVLDNYQNLFKNVLKKVITAGKTGIFQNILML